MVITREEEDSAGTGLTATAVEDRAAYSNIPMGRGSSRVRRRREVTWCRRRARRCTTQADEAEASDEDEAGAEVAAEEARDEDPEPPLVDEDDGMALRWG